MTHTSNPTSTAERIHGCLLGAVLGANLAARAEYQPHSFHGKTVSDILAAKLEPGPEAPARANRMDTASLLPLVRLGVRAYTTAGSRVTPEAYAALFRDDEGVSTPAFSFDGLHSTQEVLNEGMNPRISGMGAAPSGLTCTIMPAVGIFHAGDPDYAYLDGVELASVTQPRIGADWAGLCAAAIAEALSPDGTAQSVVEAVLRLSLENDPAMHSTLERVYGGAAQMATVSKDSLAEWWIVEGGKGERGNEGFWWGYHPIRFAAALLPTFGNDPNVLIALMLAPGSWQWGFESGSCSAVIAGALAGALHGPSVFPESWLDFAEPTVAPMLGIVDVVAARLRTEGAVATTIDRLGEPIADGATLLEDKVYGCLLASSIGNAMGSPVESSYFWEIDERFPGGIKTILEPWRLEAEDDNQMAMLLVDTYIERSGRPVMARHFGKTWYDRLDRNHYFTQCMGHAYDLIRAGWDARITGHWKQVTGSTVMCMEPVGIYHVGDPEYAYIDATAVSYMYQRGLDVVSAAILAATVSEALLPDATVDSILEAALKAAPRESAPTFDKRNYKSPHEYLARCIEIGARYDDVFAVRGELYEKCLLYSHMDPLELWGLSLAMFKTANGDVRQSAIGGTNIGRDSDTISGRAAMLSGALRGASNVPADWMALFVPEALAFIKRKAIALADVAGPRRRLRLERRARLSFQRAKRD